MITTSQIRGRLQPYVPRLTFDWLADDPDRRWRSLDGSVVFVDISGFTKLSEKLAKAGKVGAEQMADAINHCFTELLAIAYNEDGSLLKFGGDALFLLFTGGSPEDHALRAARAAGGMRKRLREVGKIETPRGSVSLRMSVGVHTGEFDFFLVGNSHRELLVTGPAATQVVTMEGTAEAGEILLSPATAKLLPGRCVGSAKGPGFMLRAAPPGDPLGLVSVIPHVADELLESCVSVANRQQLLEGAREPEHRQASVAFLHFDETDEMREHDGPEALADALHELVVVVQEAADEQQVSFLASDVDLDGGKIILTAGVPRAVGDDDERMLLALRRIADSTFKIPLRIGVNHGPVFSGDIGPSYRRTFTVMGDTVNLAARVMSKAPPGELYATGSILDLSATRFEVSELEPFMVKGKAKPVQAWAVGAPIGSRHREGAEHRILPLVGRDEEMATLERLALEAREGQGHLVEIVGEPGIGKTRLLEELVARDLGLRIMHATAEAYTSSTPYAVWRELLREMLGLRWDDADDVAAARLRDAVDSLDPGLVPWLPLLADVIATQIASTPEVDALAPEFRRSRLHDVIGSFLELSLTSPTIVAIEDGHLMDRASTELVESLSLRVGDHPWLVVIARRDDSASPMDVDPGTDVRLTLPPLSPDATRALVIAATERDPLLPHDEEVVAARSGGNPQFLLDLAQAMASGSMLPDSVEAAATARIDSLAPSDRTLLRRAAVFGVSFHPRLLEDVLGDDTPAPDDRTWARLSEFFEDDGDGYVRFRRAVIRDAAYEGLPFRTRRTLHEIVGRRLEREAADLEESADLLSLHFFLAGDHAKAYSYARSAAQRAVDRYANEEAARLYQRAIDAARPLTTIDDRAVGQLFESRCLALFDAGDFPAASEACAAARHLYRDDALGRGRMLFKRSKIEDRLGGYSGALAWATRARTTLFSADDPDATFLAAEVGSWYAIVLQGMGRVRDAARWGRRAIDEAEGCDNRRALADAFDVMDTLNGMLGRPTGESWRKALVIFEELADLPGQQRILGNLGVGCYIEGRWDEAMSYYQRAYDVTSQIGDVVTGAIVLQNMGEIAGERGAFEEAEALYRDALRVWRASKYRYMLAACFGYLGRVVAMAGRFDEALDLLRESRDGFELNAAREEAGEITARIAECCTFMGEPEAALAELASIGDQAETPATFAPLLKRVEGYALAQVGAFDRARIAFDQSLQVSRDRGARFDIAQAITGLVRLSKLDGTETPPELIAEAAEIVNSLRIAAMTNIPLLPRISA